MKTQYTSILFTGLMAISIGASGQIARSNDKVDNPEASVAQNAQSRSPDVLFSQNADNATGKVSASFNKHLIVPFGVTMTLNVPTAAPTISDALKDIATWEIYGSVVIQVSDGNYTVEGPIVLDHPFGGNIHIIGNINTPSNCTLQFSNGDAFRVATGFKIGELNGFYLKKTGKKRDFGVVSYGGQVNKLGPNVVVDGFYYGIAALNGGIIYANGSDSIKNRIEVKNSGDVGIWAISGSMVSAAFAYVHDSVDASRNLGSGFAAEFNSALVANNATSKNNYLGNVISQSGSSIRAWNAIIDRAGTLSNSTTNTKPLSVANIIINSQGSIEIFGSTVSNSLGFGDSSDGTGTISGRAASLYKDNALGSFRDPAHVKDDTTFSVNSGRLTLNSTGTNATAGATYLDQDIPPRQFSIQRFLSSGTEVWRQQFRNDSNIYEWSSGKITSLISRPTVGRISLGIAGPATTATDGFFEIPKMDGAPTGTVTSENGYAPIVFDAKNSKLWVWTGSSWKSAILN